VLYQLTWLVEADPLVLFHLRGLPREDLLARRHEHTPRAESASVEQDDQDFEMAYDASLRAARALALLEDDPAARVEHLL
jgi:uncharacterized Zn finger protein